MKTISPNDLQQACGGALPPGGGFGSPPSPPSGGWRDPWDYGYDSQYINDCACGDLEPVQYQMDDFYYPFSDVG